MDDFSAWVGRAEEREEVLDPARANALLAALGNPGELKAGDPLPALHHWLHFWPMLTPGSTGSDGHPRRGAFLPPVSLPRRMWAGGRLIFRSPLVLGERARRRSVIRAIEAKTGRSGTLVFVTVAHELHGPDGIAIEEEQDIVYRGEGVATPAIPATLPTPVDTLTPDPMLLFRYSALTMNSHRIHYDRPYATGTEGYADLVVQGPLQATLLAALAERLTGRPLKAFRFRGLAPAFADQPLDLHAVESGSGLELSTSQNGVCTMSAETEAA